MNQCVARVSNNNPIIFFPTDWSERSLRTAIQGGIHRALEEQIHLPAAIRSEIEDIIVDRLKDHLFQEIAQIDGFVQGSFAIAQEFVNSAVQSSSRRYY